MSCIGIIPARFASSRFPGKALTPIAGVALIERVWKAASGAKHLREVMIATDDHRIAEHCRGMGARVVMSVEEHATGSDRVAEAARAVRDEVVVNIQADEALIHGSVIDSAIEALLQDEKAEIATVVHQADASAVDDPQRVKVVLDRNGFALYFSRSRIPAQRVASNSLRYWQHIGVYAFRRPFLMRFAQLPRSEAERAEELEQLRALEHGFKIRAAIVEGWRSLPVDVPGDVEKVERELAVISPGITSPAHSGA